jgi:hypothetical protein
MRLGERVARVLHSLHARALGVGGDGEAPGICGI